mgnify:CR=1 FL=1
MPTQAPSRTARPSTPWKRLVAAAVALAMGAVSTGLPPQLDLVSAQAEAAANPFRVEVTAPKLAPGASGTAEVRVVVPSGFHVYRDMMWVKVLDAGGLEVGEASFPPGLLRPDPASPGNERELYDMDVIVHLPIKAGEEAGSKVARIEVGYQGCKGGLCYMPATEQHELKVDITPGAPAPAAPSTEATPVPEKADASEPGSWRDGALVSATGGAHPAGATIPAVDFSGLPKSASVQKVDAEGKDHPVHARLILDHAKVSPGQTVRLGLHLTQKTGWHTYWHSPGDIGLPTDILWDTPDGSQTTPYAYPVPHRYDVQGIISYGYDDQVLLFTELTLPPDLPAGEVVLGAKAKWLVCEIMCIPGEAELKLPVEVVTDATPKPGAYAPLFDHFAAQHPIDPKSSPAITVETGLSTSAVQPDQTFRAAFYVRGTDSKALEFKPEAGTWPVFTPIYTPEWMVTSVGVKEVEGGLLAVVEGMAFLPEELPKADRVGGLFQVDVGGETVRTEVVIDLPWAAADAKVVAGSSPLFALYDGKDTEAVVAAVAPEAEEAGGLKAPVGEDQSMAYMLVLALIGGAILNVMPCVLPVLTLKLYSVVEAQDQTDGERRAAGIAYTAGVVGSFWALALAVVVLRSVFELPVGWGFQFQYPQYVAALATIVFVFGLSLFGVFEVPAIGANSAAEASDKEGLTGHFLTGVFTTLLATPCSAPLLGTGMGFAFGLPSWGVFLFFTVAGLGLASPFLLIAFVPALMRFLPRPGAWMETFKQAMGFTLIATTVWLVDVMGGLVGQDGLVGFLGFLVAVGVGSWIFGRWGGPTEPVARQAGTFLGGVGVAALVGWQMLSFEIPEAEDCGTAEMVAVEDLDWNGDDVPWQPFSEDRVAELDGHPVFIDFTADWCLTCKVNEKTVLNTDTVRSTMQAQGIIPLKADWTRKDDVITRWLQRYGKAGVPFYLVIPKDRTKDPIPLPEVITPDIVAEALVKAAS